MGPRLEAVIRVGPDRGRVALAAEADLPRFGRRAAEAELLGGGPVEADDILLADNQAGQRLLDRRYAERAIGGDEVAAGRAVLEAIRRAVQRAVELDVTLAVFGVGPGRLRGAGREQEVVAVGRPVGDLAGACEIGGERRRVRQRRRLEPAVLDEVGVARGGWQRGKRGNGGGEESDVTHWKSFVCSA